MIKWFDKPLAEDAAIEAAHPMNSGKLWQLYEQARLLVGACHSKDKLINLVNWLLVREHQALIERGRDNIDNANKWMQRSSDLVRQQQRMVTHGGAYWMGRKLVVRFEDTGGETYLDPDVIRYRENQEKQTA